MNASQLKETTMNVNNRVLLKIVNGVNPFEIIQHEVNNIMGTKPEKRLTFIKEYISNI